jgi:hypothetical protein
MSAVVMSTAAVQQLADVLQAAPESVSPDAKTLLE